MKLNRLSRTNPATITLGLLLVVLVILLAGCATRAGYETALNSWVGTSEPALVAAWGPPDSVYENDGLRYLTYRRMESRGGSGPSIGYGIGYGSGHYGSSVFSTIGTSDGYITQCKTTFILRAGIIENYRFEGNGCRALRLTPEQLRNG
jgi:hypothetical protein